MKKAYVFRGSPSSGKGTITKEFIKQLSSKVALLELDEFRWGFHLTNREIKDVTEDEHMFAYQNFLLLLDSYCKNGNYDVVIEGLFAWDHPSPHGNMQDIIGILKKYNFDCILFLLAGTFETLWQRNTKRDYVVPREEFEMLYHMVMDKIGDEEIKVDVEHLSIADTLAFIASKAQINP